MRELKLRFIDTGDGTVYKPITLKELCLRIELPRRVILESENGDFVDTDNFLDLLEKGELTAEQYTELKDKNGKEIYEGDIVKQEMFFGDNGDITIIGQVSYIEKEAGFFVSDGKRDDGYYFEGIYEVIGNIHENPELLGDTNVTNKEEGWAKTTSDELIHEHHVFYDDIEPTKDQDIINGLKSENAYLKGKIEAYEKFLKDKGYIKEEK